MALWLKTHVGNAIDRYIMYRRVVDNFVRLIVFDEEEEMDTRLNYPEIVKTILKEYIDFFARGDVTSMHTLFDDQQQSYMLIDIGWQGKKYTHNVYHSH